MADRPRNQYTNSQSHPNRNRRRRRKNEQFIANAIAFLIVAILVVVVVTLCWIGAQKAWNGLQEVLGPAPTDDSTESTVADSVPVESTSGDLDAPVLEGVHDFLIYQGDTISYMRGITATDETDPAPKITVDNSAVDLSKPGEYQVIYTATDASGNFSQATATVTVLVKQANFVDLETIYAAVDAKLAQIIKADTTTKQKVQAIYSWANRSGYFSYGGHSDRTDYRQTAYDMLKNRTGDCYGYFAVTKLMFERLGIPNIDVQKVRNYANDSDHFWSMVSVDGGETWYHFDATPRKGEGDDFCLVTDAFLDAYSNSHNKCHNRNKSLYPKTP